MLVSACRKLSDRCSEALVDRPADRSAKRERDMRTETAVGSSGLFHRRVPEKEKFVNSGLFVHGANLHLESQKGHQAP